MKQTINSMVGLVYLISGCATTPTVRTPSVPEESKVSGRTSIYDRFDRLRELEPHNVVAVSSEEGPERYVMSPITHQRLQSVAGIYASTAEVTFNGEGYPSVHGTYYYETHPEAMKEAYRGADSDGDFVITFVEADGLLRQVLSQYSTSTSEGKK